MRVSSWLWNHDADFCDILASLPCQSFMLFRTYTKRVSPRLLIWVFKCPFGLMGLKLRIHPVPLLHIKTLAYKDSSCQNQNLLWQHYHKDLNRNPQSCDLRKGPVTCSAAIGWSILFYFFCLSAAFTMFGVCQMSNLLCAITDFFI